MLTLCIKKAYKNFNEDYKQNCLSELDNICKQNNTISFFKT